MERIKVALAIGSIILLLLIAFLLSFLNKKGPEKNLFPINVFRREEETTSKPSSFSKKQQLSPTLTPSLTFTKTTFPTPEIFSKSTALKIQNVASRFPLETDSYQASFSAMTGKILLLEKKPGGKEQLNNSLANLGIPKKEIQNLVVSASSPEELKKYQEAEEIVVNRKIEETIKIRPTPTPYKFKSVEEYRKEQELRATKSLENTIRKIFSILSTPAEYFAPEKNTSPSMPEAKRSVPPNLRGIVLEVSQKVGVPEGVIMGVISIENPAVFYLPEIKVREYSEAGAVWPECRPNVCSAAGPMQMTTGIDSFGSSSCSRCCWNGKCLDTRGGCPNQWVIYGQAVNLYGGYNRNPNPCNILDNIYAGALKLKTDSKAKNPFVWTKEEVFRAAQAYYGNCTVRYPRLGNRTYCEYVWDYYQSYNKE